MRYNSLSLRLVDEMPATLEPGILFVSKRFKVAGHLCACGCGNKVVVRLGDPGYTFTERSSRPTLRPSIGSWQLDCRSHYFITDGQIDWREGWSDWEVQAGREAENDRLEEHYRRQAERRRRPLARLWAWLLRRLGLER